MRYFIFILLFSISTFFAQNNLPDNEYQKLHEKARALINSNIDSSFICANKIEKSNNNLHKTFAFGIKSYLFQLKGDSIKSKELYKNAFQFLTKVPESEEKTRLNAYLLNYGGLANWKRGNLNKALILYQQGEKLSVKANDILQIVKFNSNISNIYGDTKNYKLAIEKAKKADDLLNKNQSKLTKDQFENNKSNININLGNFYENVYYANNSDESTLENAISFYKKSILYSKNYPKNKIRAQINLGNIYLNLDDFSNAEKTYNEILLLTNNDKFSTEYYITNYNLGNLLYNQKKNEKALICFTKVDSIYKITKTNPKEFYLSNYYQAKIYNKFDNVDKAIEHSSIYIENFEKTESKLMNESKLVNSGITNDKFKDEMKAIQKKHENKQLYYNIFKVIMVLIFVVVLVLLVKNNQDKKVSNEKIKTLIREFKQNQKTESDNLNNKETILNEKQQFEVSKSTNNSLLNIDELKETEIIKKLKDLEHKLIFLNQDYTQQFVAKKIKTNTTYLSFVVNKNFGKSFSEYANELKINYAINEMINNVTYRKYSTQAIAESVGFKNASSFTKSFKKRTGVTPVLFAQNI